MLAPLRCSLPSYRLMVIPKKPKISNNCFLCCSCLIMPFLVLVCGISSVVSWILYNPQLPRMGIDLVIHEPFSHLMFETLPPPSVSHLAEAALRCFKDEMLHFLTKECIYWQQEKKQSTMVLNLRIRSRTIPQATFLSCE